MSTPENPIELTPKGVDPNAFMLQDIDTSKAPIFSIGEISKVFFDVSDHTVRLWEKQGMFFLYDPKLGKDVAVATRRSETTARQYTLSDVELMAHALGVHGVLDGEKVSLIVTTACLIARIYGYIDEGRMAINGEITE